MDNNPIGNNLNNIGQADQSLDGSNFTVDQQKPSITETPQTAPPPPSPTEEPPQTALPTPNNDVNFIAGPEKEKPMIKLDNLAFDSSEKIGGSIMKKFFSNKKILIIILLVAFVLALSASGVLGYSIVTKNKTLKSKETAILTKDEKVKEQEVAIKKLQDDLAAANTAIAATAAAAPVAAPTTTTTTKKSTASSSQEAVVAPPPPPAD